MKTNTKLVLIFFLGVVLPVVLVFFNGYIAGKSPESWSENHLNNVSTTLLVLSILSCIAVTVINFRGQRISFWYTLSIASAVAMGLLLYVGLSVSNFGF